MHPTRTLPLVLLTGLLLSACGGAPDTVRPFVSLTATPEVLTAGGVKLMATASDNVAVTKVSFYRGETLLSEDAAAPYEATDTPTAAQNGVVTYRAVAVDAAGNTAEAVDIVEVALDAGEPNDSVAAAKTLTLGTAQQGIIAGQDRDFDYFKFDAAAGDMLKLTVKSLSVNPASTLDPYVMILLPDGKTVLEKDDDSGAGLESEIRFNVVQPGTYTVVVTSFDIHDDEDATDNRATNTYQILLTRR